MRRARRRVEWSLAIALAVSPGVLAQTVSCKPAARVPGIGFEVWQDSFRWVRPGSQVVLGPDVGGPSAMGSRSCNQAVPATYLWSTGETTPTITVTAPPADNATRTYTLTTTSAGETRSGSMLLQGLPGDGPVCTLSAPKTTLSVGESVTVSASCSPPSTSGFWSHYSSDTTGTATFSFPAVGGYITEFFSHNGFANGETVAVGFTVVPAGPAYGALGFTQQSSSVPAGSTRPVILTIRRAGADLNAPAASVGYSCSVSTAPPGGVFAPTYVPAAAGTLNFPTPASTATLTVTIPELAPGTTGATVTCALSNPQPAGVTIDAPNHSITVVAPVFPMSVTRDITSTSATVSALIGFRPQDVGTNGSVYVFALAPATIVAGATVMKDARIAWKATGPEKESVACVLAQLNATGQLQAVSASSLQAYVTGVLSGQGQAITVLNGAPTATIAGATFYVGYGANATAMLNGGINRSVAEIPGAVSCAPQPPQTGWWWNTAEGGRGYSLEARGNLLFFAAYLYEPNGRATWTIAAGNTSLDGSLFVGRLESYAGGQALASEYRPASGPSFIGDLTLAFNDASHGSLAWPGGTVPIERFNIIPGGLGRVPLANQPESGWWWNPDERGRGYFLEWQGDTLFMAGYMYDGEGNPLWYLASASATNLQGFSGTWAQYANGQSMTGAYRPAQLANTNVAPVTIQFQGAATGLLTLPGNRTTTIRRYRF